MGWDGHVAGLSRRARGSRPRRSWDAERLAVRGRCARPGLITVCAVGLVALVLGGCVTSDPTAPGAAGGIPAGETTGLMPGGEPGTSTDGAPGGPLGPSSRDDRPAVGVAAPDVAPVGLDGVTWSAPGARGRFVAGSVGSRARLVLPPAEATLAVGRGAIATVDARDGDATSSLVRIRAAGDGRPTVEVRPPFAPDAAAFADDRLLLAGHDAGAPGRDPGVLTVSVSDGSSYALIPSGDGADPTAAYVRTIRVSPSGRTGASGLCTSAGCALDAIDLSTGSVRRLEAGSPDFPGVVTDQVLLVGDPDSSSLAGIDLASGQRLWERRGAEFQYAYATADGAIVLSYIDHAGPFETVVAVVDALTGEERVVLRRDAAAGLTLWPELSTDAIAVLGTGGRFADAAASGALVRAATLDLASGVYEPDAVRIEIAP